MPPSRILAVSPGARTTGIAVVGPAGDLHRFDVIPLGSQTTIDAKAKRLRLHLSAILDIEEPTEVICEALVFGRSTPGNERLTNVVHDLVTERGLPLRYLLLRDARAKLGFAGDLAAELAGRYPRLRWYTPEGRADRAQNPDDLRRYWSRAFAALAIALASYSIPPNALRSRRPRA